MSTDKLNLGTSEPSEWPKTARRRGRRAGSSVPQTDVVCDGLCGLTRRGAPVGIAFVVTPVQPAMDEPFRDKNTPYSEFTPVIPRRKRKNKSHQVRPPLSVLLQRTRDEISNDNWFSQCQSQFQFAGMFSYSISVSLFLHSFSNYQGFFGCLGIITESLESFPNKSSSLSILCLGLGSPSASTVSRTQLAFLMELCSALDIVRTLWSNSFRHTSQTIIYRITPKFQFMTPFSRTRIPNYSNSCNFKS
jgi:hypothetical protein